MDPSYLHHNNRYATFNPRQNYHRSHSHNNSSSNNNNNHPQNPNLYVSHHISSPSHQPQQLVALPLPPPPPLPPLHRQQSFRPFVHPQIQHEAPYEPYDVPYDTRGIIERNNHHPRLLRSSSQLPFHDVPQSPRVSNRVMVHSRDPEFERDNRSELPVRVVSENRPYSRTPPHIHRHVVNMDHHRQFEERVVSPERPVDRFRYGLDGSPRARKELNDHVYGNNMREEFGRGGRVEENSHRRVQFVSDSERSSREVGVLREYESNSGHYDKRHGSNARDGMMEKRRRGNDRLVLRGTRDSSIERGNIEMDEGGVPQIFTRKMDYHSFEAERFTENEKKEANHEFIRSPWKQVQKKSALLRIQIARPNHRNREDERSPYSSGFEENKSSSFRGKDPLTLSGLEEKERNESHLELDVSFKSNSLVAKAIVAPSSSGVVSDLSVTPSKTNVKEVNVSGKDSKILQTNALMNEQTVKLDTLKNKFDKASKSDRDLKQSQDKLKVSGVGDKRDGKSKPSSSGTNVSIGMTEVRNPSEGIASDRGCTNTGLSKMPLQNTGRKKKIVKRVVKKVIRRPSCLPGSQSAEKLEEPMKAVNFGQYVHAPSKFDKVASSSVEKLPSGGISPMHTAVVKSSVDEIVLSENDKKNGSPKDIAGTICRSKTLAGAICRSKTRPPNIKRKYNSLTSPLSSLSHGEAGSIVNPVDSATELCTMSNKAEVQSHLQTLFTKSDINDVEDARKQYFWKGESTILKNGTPEEPLEASFPVNGDDNSCLLSCEINNIHEDTLPTSNVINGMSATNYFKDGVCNSQENDVVSRKNMDPVFADPIRPSIESGVGKGSPGAISVDASRVSFHSSSSAETTASVDPSYSNCRNHGRLTLAGPDHSCTSSEKVNDEVDDDFGRQPCKHEVTISPKNGASNESPNITGSVGFEETIPNISSKREDLTKVDLSSSIKTDVCDVHVDSSVYRVDTTLSLSRKRSCPAEVTDNALGGVNVFLQPHAGRVFDGSSLLYGFSEPKVSINRAVNVGLGVKSLEIEKKLSVPPCYHGLSSPTPYMISNIISSAGMQNPGVEAVSSCSYISPTDSAVYPDVVLESSSAGESNEPVGIDRGAFMGDSPKVDISIPNSCSVSEDFLIPSESSLKREQIQLLTPIMAGKNGTNEVMGVRNKYRKGKKTDEGAVEHQDVNHRDNGQCIFPSQYQSSGLNKSLPSKDLECVALLASKYHALVVDGSGVAPRLRDNLLDSAPDVSSDMDFLAKIPTASGNKTFYTQTSHGQVADKVPCRDEHSLDEKSTSKSFVKLPTSSAVLQQGKVNSMINHPRDGHLVSGQAGLLTLKDSNDTHQTLNSNSKETQLEKNCLNQAIPKSYSGRSSLVSNGPNHTVSSSTHATKPRTWHRAGNASASALPGNKSSSGYVSSQGQVLKKPSVFQTSYIRKGNSLLRKPPPGAAISKASHDSSSSVYRLQTSGVDEVKNIGSEGRVDTAQPPNIMPTVINAPLERPKTPPLPSISKVPNRGTHLGEFVSSPLVEPLSNDRDDVATDSLRSIETSTSNSFEDGLKVSEIPSSQANSANNLECQSELNTTNMVSSNEKRITYVKRKSNQLVATSNVGSVDKAQGQICDGYYKRRKNQLIRTSGDSHIKQTVSLLNEALNNQVQRALKKVSVRSYLRRSQKALGKPLKRSKRSLVWTLHGAQLSKSYGNSFHQQKVYPQLFPWKRAAWRSSVQNTNSISRNSSLSKISQKLLLSRKRDTIYTRSNYGFSLRKSKVLSVGGSNLKWSKSIERNSKKANEEATRAVAAVEKEKREKKTTSCVSRSKNRNISRERIFRIGSVRYKMDPTRRTLQRISDDESASTSSSVSETKKYYVPRRLVIGKNEYVRIGNGNQLIRDPKKWTRVLASEKVRWSLHTARLRLARKRKYCQFFTRFGKCNKDDGKCPYIHDPSKVAVCTKFLKGLCSNRDCKLTHEVIPDRMPDCSYFLQGLCTNKSCPYRHVHVNPSASSCEGFLRGYCAEGNECRKKHSYICPIFEATGSCPEGSKCKLHHPKKRSKGRKRRRLNEDNKNNTRGRYFGRSLHSVDVSSQVGGETVMKRQQRSEYTDVTEVEEEHVDYISLCMSDDGEAGENNDFMVEEAFGESFTLDLELDDLDELIKPVRIMNKSMTT